jgi:hypothetical protein
MFVFWGYSPHNKRYQVQQNLDVGGEGHGEQIYLLYEIDHGLLSPSFIQDKI